MEIKHIEGYDCIDHNLNIVLKNKKIDIRKAFSNLWYFEFEENSETLGKGLMQSDNNKYEQLKKKLNINYIIYENESRNKEIKLKDFGISKNVKTNKIDEIIKNKCIDNNVIVIELDTFKYKYDKGFQKYTGTHSCIITEIEENKARIIDAWYKLNNVEIDYEELLNAVTRIIILDISNIKEELDKENIKHHIQNERSFIEMERFFKKIKNIDLMKEFGGLDFEMVFKAHIDKGLRKIIMNRQRFAYYLFYLSEQLNNKAIRTIGECMFIIAMDWTKLRSILVQSYFLGKSINKEQLDRLTANILKKEMKIKEEIEEIK